VIVNVAIGKIGAWGGSVMLAQKPWWVIGPEMPTIHIGALNGRLAEVTAELQRGVAVDVADSTNQTALCYAVDRGHLAICQLLMDHKATVNPRRAPACCVGWGRAPEFCCWRSWRVDTAPWAV